jgi:hypothetical protein
MVVRRIFVALLAGAGLAALPSVAPEVHAAEFVEGRYLAEAFAEMIGRTEPAPAESAESSRLEDGSFVLSFTPRSAFATGGSSEFLDEPTLSLSLSSGRVQQQRLDLLNIAGADLGPGSGAAPADTETMLVGSAMQWGDWSIGSSLLQADAGLAETRVLGASIGFGRVSAGVAYGLTEGAVDPDDREFVTFSTNLAARSWLALEGDVGYAPGLETEEPSTVGRIGVRLRF